VADDLRQRIADVLDDLDYGHDQQERRYVFVNDVLEAVMAVRDEDLQAWRERAEKAEAAIARVREQHPEHEGRCARCLEPCTCLDDAEQTPDGLWNAWANVCAHGNADWPCPTIRALDDSETDRG
jgi:hypothetical protein